MGNQEFSSPGQHMASKSYEEINSGTAYRNPNDTRSPTQIMIDRGLEYSNETGKWTKAENIKEDYENYYDKAYKYNTYYMKYNNDLYRQAMEYDKYMSNTAIQRQMEDLKKAGINPILAGRLGGATYKGVNAPYVSINPGSTLAAMSDFYQTKSNNYYKEEQLKLDREKMTLEEKLTDKKISAELYKAHLDNNTLLEIAKQNNLTKEEIAELEEAYKIKIQEMYDEVLKEVNQNNIESNKEINNNNRITGLIDTGLKAIGYTIGAILINKFTGFGGGKSGFGSAATKMINQNRNREDYSQMVRKAWELSNLGLIGVTTGMPTAIPIF